MPRGDQPTTVASALVHGWVYEDQLPKSMTKPEYDAWYPESLVLDGVRMGPNVIQTQIDKLTSALDQFDQNKYGDDDSPDPVELFRELFLNHIYELDGDRKVGTSECESVKFPKSEGALVFYRLLYLARPKQLDFSDMYKTGSLFALVSPHGQFVADIEFWKYEPCVRFSGAVGLIEGESRFVACGIPGTDNGWHAKSPELKAWMALLQRCLRRQWMIYSGNEFEV